MNIDISKIDAVISDLLIQIAQEKEKPTEFREGFLAMGQDGGKVVEAVCRMAKPIRGLEIGTSSGFSALCAMRGALSAGVDFHLVTVDHDPAKGKWAQKNFDDAGVDERITIIIEDGLDAATKLPGPWDYVLLDAAKVQNLPILKELIPKLNPGGVILTDNMTTHTEVLSEFAEYIRNHPQMVSGLFEMGNGVEITIKL